MATPREQLLEKRIEILKERIVELEANMSLRSTEYLSHPSMATDKSSPSLLVLPITYTPEHDPSPGIDIVSFSSVDENSTPLLLVEQMNPRVYETIV